jgi:insertion element IS1 protein InsB
MQCQVCNNNCQKAGRQKNGAQKLYCTVCKKYGQATYQYKAYQNGVDPMISQLVCESAGIRGISRILKIGVNTVLRRIRRIAARIDRPIIVRYDAIFEVDELWTYIGRKDNEYWLAYALDRATGQVIDFVLGKRTKSTLKILIDNLLAVSPKKIRTDRLTHYQRLIPKALHRCGAYCINHIERKNLSIRTHIKRLSRRTICFSRSALLLESCLKIYFWG